MKFLILLLVITCLVQTVSSDSGCSNGVYDIVFVVDESGSVTKPNFQLTINSIVSFVQQLNIGKDVSTSPLFPPIPIGTRPRDNRPSFGLVRPSFLVLTYKNLKKLKNLNNSTFLENAKNSYFSIIF